MTGPIFNQSIEVANPVAVSSPYSTEEVELSWEDADWQPVDFPVSVQPWLGPGFTTEGPDTRPSTIDRYILYTPPGTDIPALASTSRVRLGRQLVMEMRGSPSRWPDPENPGRVHHVEAYLEVFSG